VRQRSSHVMTMSNNYQGPPEDFGTMVVPVPVVLHKEDVKTLPLTSSITLTRSRRRPGRIWEQDPCRPFILQSRRAAPMSRHRGDGAVRRDLGVRWRRVLRGDTRVVILSARDSAGRRRGCTRAIHHSRRR